MLRIVFVFLLCFFTHHISFSVNISRFETITDRNGLSQNTVRCMMQDSRGFMWMGTVNGLNRYNGEEFVTIQPHVFTGQPFSDNKIRSINEDKNGYIWGRTFSNTVFCYNLRSESFIDYQPQNTNKVFSNIRMTTKGDVWLYGNKGCCRIKHTQAGLKAWQPNENRLKSHPISFVLEDAEQVVWVGTKECLYKISGNKVVCMSKGANFLNAFEAGKNLFFITENSIIIYDKKRQIFKQDLSIYGNQSISYNRSCLLPGGYILIAAKKEMYAFDTKTMKPTSAYKFFKETKLQNVNLITDNKGGMWAYNMTGTLWRYDAKTLEFKPLSLMPSEILSLMNQERYQIFKDSRNIIWITTFGNGLFAIDDNNGQIYHYTSGKDLPTNYLLSVTEDRSGEIWIGTELSGVTKISLTNYPVKIFYPSLVSNNNRDNAVRLIYEDSANRYWIGTRDGKLHIFDSFLKKIQTHQIKGGLPFTMVEDAIGNKWVGTKGSGIWIYPPSGMGQPQIYRLQDKVGQSSSSNNVFTIMRDKKNRMWAASFGGGLLLAEHRSGQLVFRQIYMQKTGQNMMRSMIQDHRGLIWVGCNEGIIVFNPDAIIRNKSNYINLHLRADKYHSLNDREVRVVFEDSKKRIWLGTAGGGLFLLQRKEPIQNSQFKQYNSAQGLTNEMIQSIREDNEGNIWVSTEGGIAKFNPQTERFENFYLSNNQFTTVFNELSSWKKKNGELMFGSYNGIYTIRPESVTYDKYAPPVVITRLRINGSEIVPGDSDSPLTESITTTRKIELKHNLNSFNLECALLNYRAPEFNQYSYYLEGYEKEWNPISRNNIASYRNIPPGTYRFHVKGGNSFGVWSKQETILEIVVLTPWWKSAWAILIYIVIGGIVAYSLTRLLLKMHRLNMEIEVEKQLTEYKLRFFTNISHEFRTPLTIIRGSIESMSSLDHISSPMKKQLDLLSRSSSRLVRLIDQLLEFRRMQNNRLELYPDETEVKSFFYEIWNMFKDMADKKQIEFIFDSSRDEHVMLIDRNKLDKVAYNLLSNAFKNTPQGGKISLTLRFSTTNDTFTLSVSDSGPGIPKEYRHSLFERFKQFNYSSEGTGIGLHLTSELVKVHQGDITYSDSEWGGACFSVSIPLSGDNYSKINVPVSNEQEADTSAEVDTFTQNTLPADELPDTTLEKPYKDYKLMIIEDNDDVREFLDNQLSMHFTVITAVNGVEGLEKVAEEQPDIVICDVMMPEMDGYEFTRRLKGNFETSHIPVILLTAYSSEEHKLKGIQCGADSYITKPFNGKYLFARTVKLLEQRETLRQKFATEPGLASDTTVELAEWDKTFLDKIHKVIEDNFDKIDFKLDENFAQSLNMSRSTFFRKLKGITGYSPNEYLRIIRLKKAAELLMTTNLNVSEISYKVGIDDPYYLSKCFKAQFGKSPLHYRNNQ